MRMHKLIPDMSPAAGSIQNELRTRQLKQLNVFSYCQLKQPVSQDILLFQLRFILEHFGSIVQDAV
jgi:hypothetical protein